MTARIVIGCDPGFTGAIAVLGRGAPTLYRMPLLKQKKHAYHVVGIIQIMHDVFVGCEPGVRPLMIIERVTRPSSLTRCMGILEAAGEAFGFEAVTVRPQEWKGYFNLGPAKADAIALALKRWPSLRRIITKARDDGLAESALLALWGREVVK